MDSPSPCGRRPPAFLFALWGLLLLIGCAFIPIEESRSFLPPRPRFAASHAPYADGDILFSHEIHAFADCETCHFGSTEAGGGAVELPSMAVCFECHDGRFLTRDCIACHIENRKERKPRFHDGLWPRHHKLMAETEEYKCSLCHTRSECQSCHLERKPLSHTPRFERSTHGRMAVHDRRSCATCHESGFCENCHSQPPPDHTPLFMGIIAADGTVRAGHKQAALLRGRSCLTCHSFERACQRCHG
jgi:hypothetical protein